MKRNLYTTKKKIKEKTDRFVNHNKGLLEYVRDKRIENNAHIEFIDQSYRDIYIYLSNVKIMITTANEIERLSLFAFFADNSKQRVVRIAKNNVIYSFFRIGDYKIVHIEPENIGSYTHGGAAHTIKEAMRVVRPSVVISLGVAFGANYEENEIGDVLVGRQHFSYDKSVKVSNNKLAIKKLHVAEPDEYMLSRFKALIPTEEEIHGKYGVFKTLLENMVTGEFIVDSVELRDMIFSPFEPFGIIGGEMEAYGIFEEVKKYQNVHCILIKGICDWGAGKNDVVEENEEEDEAINYNNKIEKYNPKNDFQTLAMFHVCEVCKMFLNPKFFDELKI